METFPDSLIESSGNACPSKKKKSLFDSQSQSSSSGPIQIEKRARLDFKPDAGDLNVSSSNDSAPTEGTNRGEKRKETRDDNPSPSLKLAVGIGPMPNGDVLHPFAQQSSDWNDFWLEQIMQGNSAHFQVHARTLINQQVSVPDRDAVKGVCTFFMNLKKNTCLFQHRIDWKNPSHRVKTVLDKIS